MAALNAFWLDERTGRYIVTPFIKAGKFLDRIDTEYIDRFIGLPSLATYQRNDIFLDGFLQKTSALFNFFEFKFFREGVNNALSSLLETLAKLSYWIEERVFNQWINEGITAAGWRLGNILAMQEEKLDRPRVIIFASVLFFSTFIVWIFG
jgi:hypothetical protein